MSSSALSSGRAVQMVKWMELPLFKRGKKMSGTVWFGEEELGGGYSRVLQRMKALDKLNAKLLPAIRDLGGSQWKQQKNLEQAKVYTGRIHACMVSLMKQLRLVAGTQGEGSGQVSFPKLHLLSPLPETDHWAGQAISLTQRHFLRFWRSPLYFVSLYG